MNRSINYLQQLKYSFIFKALAIVSSFLIIPVMIKYLGNEQYGIWSTLLSIVSWLVLFDIGIGNSLRNKISESLAKDNILDAKKHISTSYIIIGMISVSLLSVFLILSIFIPWQNIFNTKLLNDSTLRTTVNIMAVFIFLNLWLNLVNQVANGLQKSSVVVFNQFLSNIIALMSVSMLSSFYDTSLIALAFFYGISLIISNLIVSFWLFKQYPALKPNIFLFEKKIIKTIVSLGMQFFIIQIAILVVFTTDKILITQLFGPTQVTNYDVVFKLFSIIAVTHSLLMAPLWAAYSDAYHRADMEWIQKTLTKQIVIYFGFIVFTIVLMLLAQEIILLWIGNEIEIDPLLIITMGCFILVSAWNNIFAYFLNAIDATRVQIYTSIVAMIINIPLALFIVKYFETGVYGVLIATIISLSIFAISGPIQSFYVIRRCRTR